MRVLAFLTAYPPSRPFSACCSSSLHGRRLGKVSADILRAVACQRTTGMSDVEKCPREHLRGLTSLRQSRPRKLLHALTTLHASHSGELVLGPASAL